MADAVQNILKSSTDYKTFSDFYQRYYLSKNSNINNRRIQAATAIVGGARGLYSLFRMKPVKILTSAMIVAAGYGAGRGLFEKDLMLGNVEKQNIGYLTMAPLKLGFDSLTGNVKVW